MFDDRWVPIQFGNVPEWFSTHTQYAYAQIVSIPPPPIWVQMLLFAALGASIAIAGVWIGRYSASSIRRARIMRKEQCIVEKAQIGDALVDAIEDLVANNKLTRARAQFWYGKLGHHLTIPDVLPQQLKNLKTRLRHKHSKKERPANVVELKPKKRVGEFLKK